MGGGLGWRNLHCRGRTCHERQGGLVLPGLMHMTKAGAWMSAEGAHKPVQLRSGETATHAAGHMGIQTDHQPVAHGHPTGRNRGVSPQATSQQMGLIMVPRHDHGRAVTGGQLIPKQPIGCPGFILAQVTRQQDEVGICAAGRAKTGPELDMAVDATVVSSRVSQQVRVCQLSHCPCCWMCQWSERLLVLPHIATGSVQFSWCPVQCLGSRLNPHSPQSCRDSRWAPGPGCV